MADITKTHSISLTQATLPMAIELDGEDTFTALVSAGGVLLVNSFNPITLEGVKGYRSKLSYKGDFIEFIGSLIVSVVQLNNAPINVVLLDEEEKKIGELNDYVGKITILVRSGTKLRIENPSNAPVLLYVIEKAF